MNYSIDWDGPGERDRESPEPDPRAKALVSQLREQNWKNGGHLVMDIDESVALVLACMDDVRRETLADAGWAPLAKALFEIERNPDIKDQAWFDFQSKAQRIIAILSEQKS